MCVSVHTRGGTPILSIEGGSPIPGQDIPPIPGQDGGGTPSQLRTRIPLSQVRMGGTPSQVRMGGYPIPEQDRGYPHPRSGWGIHPSEVRMEYSPPPVSRMGYQPIQVPGQDRGVPPTETAEHVLAMRWAACPLCSRRGTFLFILVYAVKFFFFFFCILNVTVAISKFQLILLQIDNIGDLVRFYRKLGAKLH